MKLIDLSQPVYHECPNCPVHPPVRVDIAATHERDGWRLEMMTLASHTGSHVDAPLHKLAGAPDLDAIPLERWVGPAVIADVRGLAPSSPIGPDLLRDKLRHADSLNDRIVLLATGWGDRRARNDLWHYQSPYLSPDGARWLVERKIRGVGIDHYSIGGSGDDNAATHEVLLGANVWIVEDLRFTPEALAVKQPAQFWALPVNFHNFTGAFCRPVLVVE